MSSYHLTWDTETSEDDEDTTTDYVDIGDAVLQVDFSSQRKPLEITQEQKAREEIYYHNEKELATKEPLLKFTSLKSKFKNHLRQPCCRAVLLWSLGLAVYVVLGYIVLLREESLPQPRPANISLNDFSEGRAVQHLRYLATNIGPRPIGSTANRQAAAYLLNFLYDIYNITKDQLNRPKMRFPFIFSSGSTTQFNKQQKVDVGDLQETRQNIYWDNLENLVILIEGQLGTNHSILVSAHYDTAILCPGAYDDASGVSVILELIVNLMNRPPLRHSVIFLLNNGHEFDLLGAKDFLIASSLTTNIDGFINLDGNPGTKSILFRSSGRWMDEAFMHVAPNPHANVLSHDALERGVFVQPSDYEVFDLLWPGLDFSYYSRRPIHHTIYDNFAQYQPGGLQFLGDNILATIIEICNSHILDWAPKNRDEKGFDELLESNIFYDIVGLFPVLYSRTISICVHIVVAALLVLGLALLIVYEMRKYQLLLNKKNHPVKFLFLSLLSIVVSFIVGVICSLLVSITLWRLNPLFYYPNIIFGLLTFAAPTLLGIILTQMIFERLSRGKGVTPSIAEKHAFWAITSMWALVMTATASLTYGYSWTYPIFLFGLFALFALIAYLINNKIRGCIKRRYNQSRGVHYSKWISVGSDSSFKQFDGTDSFKGAPIRVVDDETSEKLSNTSSLLQQSEYFAKIKEKRDVLQQLRSDSKRGRRSAEPHSANSQSPKIESSEDEQKSELQNFAQKSLSTRRFDSIENQHFDKGDTTKESLNISETEWGLRNSEKSLDRLQSAEKRASRQGLRCSWGRDLCSVLIFMIGSFVPTLVLFDVSLFLVQFAGTQINSMVLALVVSVLVFIAFINFIPLTRRAGNFLLVILVLLCCSAGLIGIAIFSKPYTQQSPLALNIRHHYFFNGSAIPGFDFNRTTLFGQGPNQNHQNFSFIDGESFLQIRTRFPYSIQRVLQRLNETHGKCDETSNVCRLPVSPPNTQPPFLNITSRQRNETHVKASVHGSSPGSFVLSFSFPNFEPVAVAVNGHQIATQDIQGFYYIVNNDTSWQLDLVWPLNYSRGPLVLRLNCDYNDIKYSNATAQFVSRLPVWMSVEGEGNSLIRVTSLDRKSVV